MLASWGPQLNASFEWQMTAWKLTPESSNHQDSTSQFLSSGQESWFVDTRFSHFFSMEHSVITCLWLAAFNLMLPSLSIQPKSYGTSVRWFPLNLPHGNVFHGNVAGKIVFHMGDQQTNLNTTLNTSPVINLTSLKTPQPISLATFLFPKPGPFRILFGSYQIYAFGELWTLSSLSAWTSALQFQPAKNHHSEKSL